MGLENMGEQNKQIMMRSLHPIPMSLLEKVFSAGATADLNLETGDLVFKGGNLVLNLQALGFWAKKGQ